MKKIQAMKKMLAFLGVALVATGTMAGSKSIQLSLTPDIALYDRSEMIEGLVLGIWSENPQTALALGIVNGSTGKSVGFSVGILNYADEYRGLQWGLVNYTKQDLIGGQGPISVLNYTEGAMNGLQCGIVNYAGRLNGLQLGLVNYAKASPSGVQIGLVNIIPQNEWFTGLPDELAPGMILVNWRF